MSNLLLHSTTSGLQLHGPRRGAVLRASEDLAAWAIEAEDFGARAGEGPGLRRPEGAVPTALRWARPALRSCLLERRERCRANGACRELGGQLCRADGVASAEAPRASLQRLPLRRQAESARAWPAEGPCHASTLHRHLSARELVQRQGPCRALSGREPLPRRLARGLQRPREVLAVSPPWRAGAA